MSDSDSKKSSSSAGFGSLGLSGFIGAIVAWCKTASFVGWVGVGKSLLVGAGTSMGATIVGIPAAIGGFIVGGIAGFLTGSKELALKLAMIGAFTGAVGGGIVGAVDGYKFSEKALTEDVSKMPSKGTAMVSFNAVSQKGHINDNVFAINAIPQNTTQKVNVMWPG